MFSLRSLGFVLVAGAFAVGCGGASENPFEAGDMEPGFETMGSWGPTGQNGDNPHCFWNDWTQDALRTLGAGALDQGRGDLPSFTKVEPKCYHIIESALACALRGDQVFYSPDTGNKVAGWWGLAPDWDRRALTGEEASWVTACMIERLNAYGVHVNILEEGDNKAIYEDLSWDVAYPFHESSAGGNLFHSKFPLFTGRKPFDAIVCGEEDLIQACGHTKQAALDARICDTDPVCGLQYIGECANVCKKNGVYWDCSNVAPDAKNMVRVQLEYNPHPASVCY